MLPTFSNFAVGPVTMMPKSAAYVGMSLGLGTEN